MEVIYSKLIIINLKNALKKQKNYKTPKKQLPDNKMNLLNYYRILNRQFKMEFLK